MKRKIIVRFQYNWKSYLNYQNNWYRKAGRDQGMRMIDSARAVSVDGKTAEDFSQKSFYELKSISVLEAAH